jgi:hypothetical protein
MANTLTNLTDTIIVDNAIEAFTAAIAPLTAFANNVSPGPAEKGDKVKVLSVAAAAAATDFVPATGYTVQDSTAEGLDVSLNKHKFVSWGLNDTEISQNPQLSLERFGRQKGFQLAKAVLQDIWSVVTLANYGAAAFVGTATTFDSDDVVDIGKACDDADWPEDDRSLILSSAYHAALRKDQPIQDASAYGTNDVIRRGQIPSLDTFSAIYKSTLVPANAQNLVGFAAFPDAILVAMRYLMPQEGNKYFQAAAITDPNGSGFTIGFRDWYDENAGQRRKVLECVYGYLKGNGSAIKRITSA